MIKRQKIEAGKYRVLRDGVEIGFAVKEGTSRDNYPWGWYLTVPRKAVLWFAPERKSESTGSTDSLAEAVEKIAENAAETVRRDQLKPGDTAVSSHYGPRVVKAIDVRGNAGQTTYILWEGGTVKHPASEIYPSDLMIEVVIPGLPSQTS